MALNETFSTQLCSSVIIFSAFSNFEKIRYCPEGQQRVSPRVVTKAGHKEGSQGGSLMPSNLFEPSELFVPSHQFIFSNQ
jgi:hypothetical protein